MMRRKQEIKKLARYLHQTVTNDSNHPQIIQLVYSRFDILKSIPTCAHPLIKDKRYHKWAGIFYGFLWELHQTPSPAINTYYPTIEAIAYSLDWPQTDIRELKKFILETLIINYFDVSDN